MKCKKMSDCAQKMHMFSKVPPLEPGETEIVTASDGPSPAPGPAAASLVQFRASANKGSTMRVNFTSMGYDQVLKNGQVDLALVQFNAAEEAEAHSWVKEVDAQGNEKEASCNHGHFHCNGDAAWCAEQDHLGCKASQATYLRQRSQSQKHLQA
jgi:hypothetical protein